MARQPKVRIGGEDAGASKAIDAPRKAFEKLGAEALDTGKDIEKANKKATRSEKEFEQAVAKAVGRLKKSKMASDANAEALKRMGREAKQAGKAVGDMPGGRRLGRGSLATSRVAANLNQQLSTRGVLEGLSRAGGGPAEAFGRIATALGGVNTGLVAVGVGAAAAGLALKALTANSDRAASQAAELEKMRQEQTRLTKVGNQVLAQGMMTAAGRGGASLREAVAGGISLGQLRDTANRLKVTEQEAIQIEMQIKGVSKAARSILMEAFDLAEFISGPGGAVRAAEAARKSYLSGGNIIKGRQRVPGTGEYRDLTRDEMIGFIASEARQGAARGDPSFRFANDLRTLRAARATETAAGRQQFANLTRFDAGRRITAEGERITEETRDPVAKLLEEHAKSYKNVADQQQAAADAAFILSEQLRNLGSKLGLTQESFGAQAQRTRDNIAAAGAD